MFVGAQKLHNIELRSKRVPSSNFGFTDLFWQKMITAGWWRNLEGRDNEF
jgi:hypothetical protein